jgi:hypothetical protein
VEAGQVTDVIYVGVLTRYVVALDAGGELVVSRQNTETALPRGTPPDTPYGGSGAVTKGDEVRVAWRAAQAFTIPR